MITALNIIYNIKSQWKIRIGSSEQRGPNCSRSNRRCVSLTMTWTLWLNNSRSSMWRPHSGRYRLFRSRIWVWHSIQGFEPIPRAPWVTANNQAWGHRRATWAKPSRPTSVHSRRRTPTLSATFTSLSVPAKTYRDLRMREKHGCPRSCWPPAGWKTTQI